MVAGLAYRTRPDCWSAQQKPASLRNITCSQEARASLPTMNRHLHLRLTFVFVVLTALLALPSRASMTGLPAPEGAAYEFNDSHFHLTNYIQEGIDVHKF